MALEWDEAKRLANIEKHGIDFLDVEQVFAGDFIETEDLRRDYGEKRFRAVGQLGNHIVQIAYTWRGDRRRVIGARRAGRNDRRTYRAPVTLEQARKMKGLTDWARLDAMTEEEIERNAAQDPDNPPWTDEDWANAQVVDPHKHTPVWLDRDIVEWFKEQGPRFQGRINEVLRAFIKARKGRAHEPSEKTPPETSS